MTIGQYAAVLGCAVMAAPVAAQEAPESASTAFDVGEIVVSARKRNESLQDVPVSIAVFSSADLASKSLNSLNEIGQFTPNLNFGRHGSRATSSTIFVRGVGQTEPRIYFDPGVGLYIDGVYMGRMQGIDVDTVGLERVEVLRGPQGTLFGKNTIGGAINVVTKRPGDNLEGSIELATGRYDRMDATGYINVPLVPGKLAVSLVGATRNRDGYGKRIDYFTQEKIDETGDVDRLSGRAQVYWTPSENFSALLVADGMRVRQKNGVHKNTAIDPDATFPALLNLFVDPPYDVNFLTDSPFTTYATGGNRNDFDGWGVALTAEWKLDWTTIKSISSYREQQGINMIEPDGSIYTLLDLVNTTDQDQFSQELQFTGTTANDRLEWVFGLYYFEEHGFEGEKNAVFRELLPLIGLDLSRDTSYTTSNKSYATYGQGTYRLTDRLSVTAGVRYTYETKKISRQTLTFEGDAFIVPNESRNDSWGAFSGRLGLEYRWNDDLMSYASVANGFKSGGIFGDATKIGTFLSWDPEYLTTYEVGLRSELLDRRLQLNATLFYSDYKDTQFTVQRVAPNGTAARLVDNAAASRIQGFELEAVLRPVRNLTFRGGLGYTDAKYTKFDPTIGINKDTKFASTPKWVATIGGQYVLPVGGVGDLIANVDYAYKSKIHYDAYNSPFLVQGGYGLLNARLSLELDEGRWSLSAFGTNLTNKKYINSGTDAYAVLGIVAVQYERPREWGISVKRSF